MTADQKLDAETEARIREACPYHDGWTRYREQCWWCDRLRAAILADREAREKRTFPIQPRRGAAPHPLRIPWPVAEKAYSVYAGRYGKEQSLERLAERGGFGPDEMDVLLPTWRDECDERAHADALAEALRGMDELAGSCAAALLVAAMHGEAGTPEVRALNTKRRDACKAALAAHDKRRGR